MAKNTRDVVEAFARPIVEGMGYEYVDTEFGKQGRDYILTIVIDKPGGVTLDDCEAVTRAVDPVLDEKDPIEQSYCLCVSSVGLDRPIKTDADFKRNMGKQVDVKLYAPMAGRKQYAGVLRAYAAGDFTLECGQDTIVIERKNAAKVTLHIDF